MNYSFKTVGRNKIEIFAASRGVVSLIKTITYQPSSTKGVKSEVYAALYKMGKVPKKEYEENRGYYKTGSAVKLHEL